MRDGIACPIAAWRSGLGLQGETAERADDVLVLLDFSAPTLPRRRETVRGARLITDRPLGGPAHQSRHEYSYVRSRTDCQEAIRAAKRGFKASRAKLEPGSDLMRIT